jgi:primosomal protein N' (replication factor Y)
MIIADIAVFSGIPKVLTYKVPQGMVIFAGARVNVPLKNTIKTGVVIETRKQDKDGLKEIIDLCDSTPLIPEEVIKLLSWTSKYYHAPVGACLQLAFPPLIRKGRDAQKYLTAKGKSRDDETLEQHPEYSLEQLEAINTLSTLIDENKFHVAVLHGITGSGKTEVYMACAVRALSLGRSVIYMVPEIALTPQTIKRLSDRIPYESAVFHSGLSPKKRSEEFMKVAKGDVRFVIGTRSAVFAPVRNLGLMIVDEEHDQSYKQSDGIAYNARDLAIKRASMAGAVTVLGSATPSLETYERAKKEGHTLLRMNKRAGEALLPEISVVDMRNRTEVISSELLDEIARTLKAGQQTLIFINRRGFSSAFICPGCGNVFQCRRCSRGLVYHKQRKEAVCHYCGFKQPLLHACPACGCIDIKPMGMGTERIMEELGNLVPDARLLQMDSDTISNSAKLEGALKLINDGKVDIIVGTQMISKGHDFSMLTLVGIIQAEQFMYLPDFRALERTFQQVVQVAGRAGRKTSGTKVIMQTLVPEHPVIGFISGHDYQAMVEHESVIRKQAGFPPFSFMVRCIFSSYRQKDALEFAQKASGKIACPGIRVMGPSPAPIEMLKNTYRFNSVILSESRARLHRSIDEIIALKIPAGVKVKIDVDPYDML